MKIDYCAKIKAGLFLPAFILMLELSGKTLAMCLFPGMPIVVKINGAKCERCIFCRIHEFRLCLDHLIQGYIPLHVLLTFESRDLSQADKSVLRVSSFPT